MSEKGKKGITLKDLQTALAPIIKGVNNVSVISEQVLELRKELAELRTILDLCFPAEVSSPSKTTAKRSKKKEEKKTPKKVKNITNEIVVSDDDVDVTTIDDDDDVMPKIVVPKPTRKPKQNKKNTNKDLNIKEYFLKMINEQKDYFDQYVGDYRKTLLEEKEEEWKNFSDVKKTKALNIALYNFMKKDKKTNEILQAQKQEYNLQQKQMNDRIETHESSSENDN